MNSKLFLCLLITTLATNCNKAYGQNDDSLSFVLTPIMVSKPKMIFTEMVWEGIPKRIHARPEWTQGSSGGGSKLIDPNPNRPSKALPPVEQPIQLYPDSAPQDVPIQSYPESSYPIPEGFRPVGPMEVITESDEVVSYQTLPPQISPEEVINLDPIQH